jgi:hypothetical protein
MSLTDGKGKPKALFRHTSIEVAFIRLFTQWQPRLPSYCHGFQSHVTRKAYYKHLPLRVP